MTDDVYLSTPLLKIANQAAHALVGLARYCEDQCRICGLDHCHWAVNQVGSREGHCRNVAGFSQFERRLEGGRVVVAASSHPQAILTAEPCRDLLDLLSRCASGLHSRWNRGLQGGYQLGVSRPGRPEPVSYT